MTTPTYKGPNQPAPDTGAGWLGRLGSSLGMGQTPNYSGDGQPSSSSGAPGSMTPAYRSVPSAPPDIRDPSAEAQASCPIDPGALASGHIAIVIPRSCAGDREEPAATD
jgi:hypothetical protein